ncbi:MAG: hypothetical protein IJS39_11255 [Synergistaceae bacterium]|nr:hypothetical protein [Synergistaceae bacterium]
MRRPIYERLRQTLYEREIRAEAYAEGIAIGEQRGSQKMMNIMLELMRANGLTPEQLDTIKAAALNS